MKRFHKNNIKQTPNFFNLSDVFYFYITKQIVVGVKMLHSTQRKTATKSIH